MKKIFLSLLAFCALSASAQRLVTSSELKATMQTLQRLLQENCDGTRLLEAKLTRLQQKIDLIGDGVEARGHEYVDLGIRRKDGVPVYWATTNIDATINSPAGQKFAWGDIRQVDMATFSFEWPTYCFLQKGQSDVGFITKYTVDDNTNGAIWYDVQGHFIGDGLVQLEPSDDAARQLWGGSWRIPTKEEISLLISQCDWEWTTMNAAKGYKVYNKYDHQKYIFLPASGYKGGTEEYLKDEAGWYWTSSLLEDESSYAWFLNFDSNGKYPDIWDRSSGLAIRAVCSPL